MPTLRERAYILILLILTSTAMNSLLAQDIRQQPYQSQKLQKIWETTEGLNIPESSCYNPADKTIYVSNIVGNPDKKDGMGYISKISGNGKCID